jgi:WD domain, G-beta repeat
MRHRVGGSVIEPHSPMLVSLLNCCPVPTAPQLTGARSSCCVALRCNHSLQQPLAQEFRHKLPPVVSEQTLCALHLAPCLTELQRRSVPPVVQGTASGVQTAATDPTSLSACIHAAHQVLPVVAAPGHSKWVWDCVFSVDAAYLVTASSDCTARLWDLSSGEAIRVYSGHHKVISTNDNI